MLSRPSTYARPKNCPCFPAKIPATGRGAVCCLLKGLVNRGRRLGGEGPEYPGSLKDSGVEGQVLAQFVVNESGRYESGTLKILSSSNSAFTAAVKDALPRMRFSAAQIGGKKVQQLVQMPFQFHITH